MDSKKQEIEYLKNRYKYKPYKPVMEGTNWPFEDKVLNYIIHSFMTIEILDFAFLIYLDYFNGPTFPELIGRIILIF